MRMSNNVIFMWIMIMIVISLSMQLLSLDKISKISDQTVSKMTGKASDYDGSMAICVNYPPEYLGHTCTEPIYVEFDGTLVKEYTCRLNVSDKNDDPLSFSIINQTNEFITADGNLTFIKNITLINGTVPKNRTIKILINDGSKCANAQNQVSLTFPIEIEYGRVILLQNYPDNNTQKLELSEGYTTYHRSLDEYFLDTYGYPLHYEKEFFTISCFGIDISIDNVTNLITYLPPIGSSTEELGPCIMKFIAINPFNKTNETNQFELHVKKSDLSGTALTSGREGGGGGGGAAANVNVYNKYNPKECIMIDVNCTEWTDCTFREKNDTDIIFYNWTNDGIKTRSCTWKTNCPGELEPAQKKTCNYLPTCSDSMKNCHEVGIFKHCEEGIDCGGPCEPCANCSDGIKNQGEVGIDCGGPCEPCANCFDGIQNCITLESGEIFCETDIDCGGPCAACPNCTDKIKNCHRLSDGTILCETGIDCGGPCPKCVHEEIPKVTNDSQMLDWLLMFIILSGILLTSYLAVPKIWKYWQMRYIGFLKSRILKNRDYQQTHYIQDFEEQMEELQNDFDTVTAQNTKNEGDKFLTTGTVTGYNVDRYSVSFDNDYADIITDNSVMTITYSMYLKNMKHGKRVLEEITKLGIKPNYKMSKRSSAVLWNPKWVPDPDASYEQVNGKWIARTVEYNLTFLPKDEEEAKKILKVLEIYGKGKKRKIEGSWDIPDIRITGQEEILDYEKRIVNTKSVGGQQLVILTKNKPIPGFKDTTILINPALAEYIQ
jgi:hypothetical protein